MTKTLHVPENWVMSWWSGDNSAIRMACPSCGNFSLMCHLNKPANTIRSLECGTCGLSGFEQVQAAMNTWSSRTAEAQAADDAAHAHAAMERDREIADIRNGRRKKTAA